MLTEFDVTKFIKKIILTASSVRGPYNTLARDINEYFLVCSPALI